MAEHDILLRAIRKYGERSQQDKFIEEASELIKAILKLRYCNKDYEKQIVQDAVDEEMADVQIMMEQLTMIYDNAERVELQKKKKIERLERRMNAEVSDIIPRE